jgi:hypothetical protein
VAKVGTSKAGGTISQQAEVQPWHAADAHVQQQQQQQQTSEVAAFDCRDLVDLYLVQE